MRRCNGRLFDGSACNNLTYECEQCATAGCHGDGCDDQLYVTDLCEACGTSVTPVALARTA